MEIKAAMGDVGRHAQRAAMGDVARLLARRNALFVKLRDAVGLKQANEIYDTRVKQTHYTFIHAHHDRHHASTLRLLLPRRHTHVSGPWEILPGDDLLGAWQRMLESVSVVVVLLSRALFQDQVLCMCLPELLLRSDTVDVVPVFIEPLTEQDFPVSVRALRNLYWEAAYQHPWDVQRFVGVLRRQFPHRRHYECEVRALGKVLEELNHRPR